ncbi:MAG: hypothetical protein ABIE74_00250 [Pseudomonadota bacterium]
MNCLKFSKMIFLVAFLSIFFAVTTFAGDERSYCSQGGAERILWAPNDRIGPSVLDVGKERWDGFENYDGYFWTFHAFKWNKALLDNLNNSNCAKMGELDEGVYEFRRGPDEGAAWEYWDGVWSRVEVEWFLIFPRTERRVYSEYITSLPGAGNKGTEETDEWFASDVHAGYDVLGGIIGYAVGGWLGAALGGVKVYPPVAFDFDNCGLAEPRADPPSKCDEEYEIGFDWKRLEPDRYYYTSIKFRTDAGEEKTPVDWYVNFQTEERYGVYIKRIYIPPGFGSYDNHYNCSTDTGTWSFDYDSSPRLKDNKLSKLGTCVDSDRDGTADDDDNCPSISNPGQENYDKDNETIKIGDACDSDDDNDQYSDELEIALGTDPLDSTSMPADQDRDLIPDSYDPDSDNDGIPNEKDAFPLDPKECVDTDKDGVGNNTDLDDDGDGFADQLEASLGSNPLDPGSSPVDTDDDGQPDLLDPDDDNDGVMDENDVFPIDASESIDTDGDKIGNNADLDDDGDGYSDELEDIENTDPLNPFSKPSDIDKDGVPDSTDLDIDGDGYENTKDAFPRNPREWLDTDSDGIGDNADLDDDSDFYTDVIEIHLGSDPLDLNSKPADHDDDFIPDALDPDDDNDGVLDVNDPNPLDPAVSVDTDGDGIDDRIDTDDDNDGYGDMLEISCGTDHLDANSKPADNDKDGTPDILDSDDDNDGVFDLNDAFPFDPGESLDSDGDGIGNNADTDDDNDGYVDVLEIQFGTDPLNSASSPKDFDKDGDPDSTDADDDNDTYLDSNDLFPYNKTEWSDCDSDGVGDNRDLDDDNDGYPDSVEIDEGTNPFDASSKPSDLDRDLIPDSIDDDIDGDGYLNGNEVFPRDPKEWSDFDRDGLGDNSDPDDDNDGYPDLMELDCSNSDPKNSLSIPDDFDRDLIPDCQDLDKDGDGYNAGSSTDDCDYDKESWGPDTDNDSLCNEGGANADSDDDNDGFSDLTEVMCGLDPYRKDSQSGDNDGDTLPNRCECHYGVNANDKNSPSWIYWYTKEIVFFRPIPAGGNGKCAVF